MQPLVLVSALTLGSSFLLSIILTPLCRRFALKQDIVDKPGGRKEHVNVTPLLGGMAVFLSGAVAVLLVVACIESGLVTGCHIEFSSLGLVFLGATVLLVTGLWDDCIKEKAGLAFYYKLLGQLIAAGFAMIVMARPELEKIFSGTADYRSYLYTIFFILWLLTSINSFNYSDNINGLMSGLAVISLLTSIVYLGHIFDPRFIVVGFAVMGGVLGFLPFNFPRARIFIGDAGSMFIGFWIGIILWPLTEGFLAADKVLMGLDNLLPPFLVLGVPFFDACFVLFVRAREGRPIYLGDNQHLSHRLIRCGFSPAEAALILWGLGLILAGIGALALDSAFYFRYTAFAIGLMFMLLVTFVIMRAEKKEPVSNGSRGA